MFQLNQDEWNNLKSQFVISSWGGRRTLPYAFTEHCVLMLSSVLNSLQKIIYATDYNYSDLEAIRLLCTLVRPYMGEVILVHITEDSSEMAQLQLTKFKRLIEGELPHDKIAYQVFSRKNINETLELLVETHNADMLSMTTHKRNNFFEKLFNKSLTKEMALFTNVPLFSFVKKMPLRE